MVFGQNARTERHRISHGNVQREVVVDLGVAARSDHVSVVGHEHGVVQLVCIVRGKTNRAFANVGRSHVAEFGEAVTGTGLN